MTFCQKQASLAEGVWLRPDPCDSRTQNVPGVAEISGHSDPGKVSACLGEPTAVVMATEGKRESEACFAPIKKRKSGPGNSSVGRTSTACLLASAAPAERMQTVQTRLVTFRE